MATQGVEQLSIGGVVHQDPVLDRNDQLGAVGAEAQVIDRVALGLVVPLWNLPIQVVLRCVSRSVSEGSITGSPWIQGVCPYDYFYLWALGIARRHAFTDRLEGHIPGRFYRRISRELGQV